MSDVPRTLVILTWGKHSRASCPLCKAEDAIIDRGCYFSATALECSKCGAFFVFDHSRPATDCGLNPDGWAHTRTYIRTALALQRSST